MKRKVSSVISQKNSISSPFKKPKLAQRKFAQGANNSAHSPQKIVSKTSGSPETEEFELNNFASLPTVDDFLTFLCFRETKVLPERLNYLYNPQLDSSLDKEKYSVLDNSGVVQQSNSSNENQSINKSLKCKRILGNKITSQSQNALSFEHEQQIQSKRIFEPKRVLSARKSNSLLETYERRSSRPKVPKKLDDYDTSPIKRVIKTFTTLDNSKKTLSSSSPSSIEVWPSAKISLPKLELPITGKMMKNFGPKTRSSRVQSDKLKKNLGLEKSPPTSSSSRPSRRTKEVAVVYMEMLGKELLRKENNLDDDKDVANFPELPCITKNEKGPLCEELINPQWSRSKFNPIIFPKDDRKKTVVSSNKFRQNSSPKKKSKDLNSTSSPCYEIKDSFKKDKNLKKSSEDTCVNKISSTAKNKLSLLGNSSLKVSKSEKLDVVDEISSTSEHKTISEKHSRRNRIIVNKNKSSLPLTASSLKSLNVITPTKNSIPDTIALEVNFTNHEANEKPHISSVSSGKNQVFYIPIPASTSSNALGVAVKLGTDETSQKIIMSATLVTNTSTFTTDTSTNVSSKMIGDCANVNFNASKLSSKAQAPVKIQFQEKEETNVSASTETKTQLVKILKLHKNKKNFFRNREVVPTLSTPEIKNNQSQSEVKSVFNSKISCPSINSPIISISSEVSVTQKETEKNSRSSSIADNSSVISCSRKVSINFANSGSTLRKNIPSISDKSNQATSIFDRNKTVFDTSEVIRQKKLHSNCNSSVKILKISKTDRNISKQKPKINETEEVVTLESDNKQYIENNRESVTEKDTVSSMEIIEAPTYYPSIKEFEDPLKYIENIRTEAEKYGLCRIIPPANFKPECKIIDGMRFTAYNQYVHKMLDRWGPNVKEMTAIQRYLTTQNIQCDQIPKVIEKFPNFSSNDWKERSFILLLLLKIGGMDVDLPRLYRIVQQCGGLKSVMEKVKWHIVADRMKISKHVHDRITKLDDIYCKYILPYDTLSDEEREKLLKETEEEWQTHLIDTRKKEILEDDKDKCILKGRTTDLSSFFRMARNTMLMNFGNSADRKSPCIKDIETEFWKHVLNRETHVCVQYGSIDSGTEGYGFSMAKNSSLRKHPWNLKVLTNNPDSILRFLGPVMGLTVPIIYVGMLYSTCCWYRDPHGLPWLEYLHTGANKVWYGVSDQNGEKFKKAMMKIAPRFCRNKKIWLPADTVVVPPDLLAAEGVPLTRVVQEPGQFIVVFPKAFTSSISTGYLISEIVYFAQTSWFDSAKDVFKDMNESGEPPVFSLEQLLITIAQDNRASIVVLKKVLPMLIEVQETEENLRKQLRERGLKSEERLQRNKTDQMKPPSEDPHYYECDTCHANLFVSRVRNTQNQNDYCLAHAVAIMRKKPSVVKHWKLFYFFSEDELNNIVKNVKHVVKSKSSQQH